MAGGGEEIEDRFGGGKRGVGSLEGSFRLDIQGQRWEA